MDPQDDPVEGIPFAGPDHLDLPHGIDPTDLLRAMLAINPEDAAAVREDAAEAMKLGRPSQEP